ncbi:prolyl oligopeptidase family serine peptidase [Sciscionella sediminilitoris]|uniref:prolyl oligopeptidase family serine peptidase n=1 Tax=Sciscionella sediminilitoris TaxID=1445613 RepID=UPI0004DF6309|nr:prolyl oligopeptidase family serine peptidase [Sciscionella sp. SE31]
MTTDPYLYLEDVTGTEALDWARERNAESLAELTEAERYTKTRAALLDALDTDDRIPYVRMRGEYLYNFWRDAEHPKGIWRRTTLAKYRGTTPDWEVLIDVDALAEAEGENWVWGGATVRRPADDRCLVELSRGGADATVVREFDLRTREFLPDGFVLPEAKHRIGWIDAETVYLGTDFGPGSLTDSGYPRIVKRWRRGTPLAEASTVFEGEQTDVAVSAVHDPTPGFTRDLIVRRVDFFTAQRYLVLDGELVELELPGDAVVSLHREWLLVHPRSDWGEYPTGSLLAIRLDDFLHGAREFTVLFAPDAHSSLEDFSATRDFLLLTVLTDVRPELRLLRPSDGWRAEPLAAEFADLGSADIVGTDSLHGNDYLVDVCGYTTPSTLWRGTVGAAPEPVKSAPHLFDASGAEITQYFATSLDGTRIPYTVVRPANADGRTLLTGYGGFEISLTPNYSGIIGRGWLAEGGTYVVANLRGGGEYGPAWHTGAKGAHRHRVYEDFAAVAGDLVTRGITTTAQLGIQGGSNGGLLMGVMLTRYPELFGAIVCQVPLLDMRRYHLLLAGASWMAEYGDPEDPEQWAWLADYSPYQNLTADAEYPPIFVLTSTRDDRVHPGHARKFVARLREYGHDVRYYENIEGGHGGAADNAQSATKWALVFEFLNRTLKG